MVSINTLLQKKNPLNILCLGAHADDIEIGCGGTILKLLAEIDNVNCTWIVFSANDIRKIEAQNCAKTFLKDCDEKQVCIENFRDGYFPFNGGQIKDYFEALKQKVRPDIVFTHYRHDLHQDHRLLSDLTWNTFRNHLILEYEIPKYDGDVGTPNLFVPLYTALCQAKISLIRDAFDSQKHRQWFSEDIFMAMMRLRGMESCAPSGYAEAFYARKLIL